MNTRVNTSSLLLLLLLLAMLLHAPIATAALTPANQHMPRLPHRRSLIKMLTQPARNAMLHHQLQLLQNLASSTSAQQPIFSAQKMYMIMIAALTLCNTPWRNDRLGGTQTKQPWRWCRPS
jgi:hypothetical protein